MARKSAILLSLFVLLLFVPACDGSKLMYKVTGAAAEAQVEYKNAQGEVETKTVALPWETSFDAGGGFEFEIKVKNKSNSGSVACEVWINDRRAGSASGTRLAECAGSFNGRPDSYSINFQGRCDAAPHTPVQTATRQNQIMATHTVFVPTRPAARPKTATPLPTATPTPRPTSAVLLAVDLAQEHVRYADRPAWQSLLGWPDECEETFQRTSLQKPDGDGGVAFYEVAGDHYLVFVMCTLGPYWVEERLYFLDTRLNPPTVRPLTVPELTQEDEQEWVLREVEQIHGSLPIFHPDTRTLTNLVAYRGLKDCGIFYTYRFEQVSFVLEEARYHDCDDSGVLSDQWEVIYPHP